MTARSLTRPTSEEHSLSDSFAELTDPHRRELLVYCYRMLGSMHDAEDLVQDTMLRAWRARDSYDGERASIRTWLYRIATNACLTALARADRRVLPSDVVDPAAEVRWPLPDGRETPWLEPIPSVLVADLPQDPAAVITTRDSVRLAFVVALQRLPARQRAVLILRDVLAVPAAEVAETLGTSVASVTSALQRARARLAELAPAQAVTSAPDDAGERAIVERYLEAFVEGDVTGLVSLMRSDIELEMPPVDTWYAGRELVSAFFASRAAPGRFRARVVGLNAAFGVALYRTDGSGGFDAHQITHLTIEGGLVVRIVSFVDPSLFRMYGLPAVWPE
ncbi:sigma-70 family RNA polymerase sigma factor [Microbispora sp. RL4-1S]|uniref:RNA polymerase sigma factor n=1 Tax=Microbispora oryzae TaxID=2806554 RepID=A0A941ARX9_9ACTN|nr:sigma-70 family RNA polymerase sigma factor [Microbispora oryzae]MBP2706844.1 sigma-70 family RNA polymerase sigma factor [Microbispora oryzae]